MLAALLLVFREVLEAGLIVGIVLAATEGIAGRGRWVAGGVMAGLAGAALVAVFAGVMSSALSGVGQEVFNAVILIAAVAMLAWHALWMSAHARELSQEMMSLGRSVSAGHRTLAAMALVVTVAILREGAEVVLFLFGILASGGDSPMQTALGAIGGLGVGAGVSWLVYRSLLAIPVRRLFSVTNGLIILLAAGMAGQAAVFLNRANLIPTLGDQLWDSSALLPDDGLAGRALHVLIGYSDRPMGVQLIAYGTVLVTLLLAGRWIARHHQGITRAAQKTAPV